MAPTTYGPPTFTYTNFINTAALPVTIPIGLTWGAAQHLPTTYTMQYVLNVQRTLGKSTTLEVGYNGSQSRHLAYLLNDESGRFSAPPCRQSRACPIRNGAAAGIQYLKADGMGNYNGLGAKLTQRFGTNLNDVARLHVVQVPGRRPAPSAARGTTSRPRMRSAPLPANTALRTSTFRSVSSLPFSTRCRSAKASSSSITAAS